ncbi:MAG: hypothetical protein P4M09_14160 [Devosia sp.]|nr:hypothetical protein [Devosia sp.]
MSRLTPSLVVAAAASLLAAPSFAADFAADDFGSDSSLRSGYSEDWANSDVGDPLTFELGIRYWYSWGAQKFNVGSSALTDSDVSQSGEAHFRIDDASTKTYVKGLAGMAFKIDGSASDSSLGTVDTPVTDGHIAYAGADIGYSWLGDTKSGVTFGPFAGYMYWNDSPNLGRANYSTGTTTADFTYDSAGSGNHIFGPGDSQENSIEVNMLRLGFSGKANLGSMFDVSAEVAAVPYAKVSGTLGAFGVSTASDASYTQFQSSAASIDGWGYGAMAEALVGFHPTQNLTFRVGGRAWYLQGQADTTYNTVTVTNDTNHTVVGTQEYISTANPWSLFRYGALAEMTYNF